MKKKHFAKNFSVKMHSWSILPRVYIHSARSWLRKNQDCCDKSHRITKTWHSIRKQFLQVIRQKQDPSVAYNKFS